MSNPYAPPQRGRDGVREPAPPTGGPPDRGQRAALGPDRPPAQPAPPPDPEAMRQATRQVLHFTLFMLGALVTSSLPLPWQAGALVLNLAAIVAGIRALRTVLRIKVPGLLAPALGVGLGLSVVMTVSLVTMLALWPVQMQRQECLAGALTISARQACEAQFEQALTDRLEQGAAEG